MRLLLHSNSPWASTGYGQQVALFAPKLAEHHDVAISSFYGLDGSRLTWNGIPVLPGLQGAYGNETILGHAHSHLGDDGLVLTLMDVWVLNPQVWGQMNVACWVPVDHDPAPPKVKRFFEQTDAIPIAMSRFGQERLDDALYVPHGVDTKVFKPQPRDEARELLGFPKDAFIAGVVAANKGDNPPRKSFPQILQAFKAFQARHDDAILYLHTEIKGKLDGVNIPMLMAALEIPGESVRYTDQYRYEFDPFPPDALAQMYSAMDVLLNPAMGEGFGLPMLEAQACGTPVIATDFSAMREVVGSGWLVESTPYWTRQNSWQVLPDVEDVVEALEACYRLPAAGRKRYSEKARAHAKPYDADLVMHNHFLPALREVEEHIAECAPVAA